MQVRATHRTRRPPPPSVGSVCDHGDGGCAGAPQRCQSWREDGRERGDSASPPHQHGNCAHLGPRLGAAGSAAHPRRLAPVWPSSPAPCVAPGGGGREVDSTSTRRAPTRPRVRLGRVFRPGPPGQRLPCPAPPVPACRPSLPTAAPFPVVLPVSASRHTTILPLPRPPSYAADTPPGVSFFFVRSCRPLGAPTHRCRACDGPVRAGGRPSVTCFPPSLSFCAFPSSVCVHCLSSALFFLGGLASHLFVFSLFLLSLSLSRVYFLFLFCFLADH